MCSKYKIPFDSPQGNDQAEMRYCTILDSLCKSLDSKRQVGGKTFGGYYRHTGLPSVSQPGETSFSLAYRTEAIIPIDICPHFTQQRLTRVRMLFNSNSPKVK